MILYPSTLNDPQNACQSEFNPCFMHDLPVGRLLRDSSHCKVQPQYHPVCEPSCGSERWLGLRARSSTNISLLVDASNLDKHWIMVLAAAQLN